MTINATARETWDRVHSQWPRLAAPLRPNTDVCGAVRALIAGRSERVLLLGVTPEFAMLGDRTVAVDWSDYAVAHTWPGDSPRRRAVTADWLQLPWAAGSFAAGSFSASIGDGSANCLEFPSGYRRLFRVLASVVRPGGRIVLRLYVTPESCESLEDVRQRALAGDVASIHALKWRVANAVCADRCCPNVAVRDILAAFNSTFPDRRTLARATGWSEDEIGQVDVYAGSASSYSFPTAAQALQVMSDSLALPRVVTAGVYELAERCPLVVAEVRS